MAELSPPAAPLSPLVPRIPFQGWKPQVVDESIGLLAWHVPPAVIIFQIQQPKYGMAHALRVVDLTDRALAKIRGAVHQSGGMIIVHDLRCIETVDKAAQEYLNVAWQKITPADVKEGFIVFGPKVNLLMRMVIHSVNIVAAIRTGKVMRLVSDPAEPLGKYGIQVPPADTIFPGQEK